MGQPKIKWTEEEELALLTGVEKHGPGKWKNILKDPEFADQLSNRSNIDLKDKWRNISVAPDIQGSKDKIRTPKIKAVAFQLAAVAAASNTPSPSSNQSPVAPLHRSGSDLSIDDSCNVMLDAKNVPRYDGMIFEALSALTDANGSDVTAIFNFIVQKGHEVPPFFKRILSSRLRRLASQGRLEKVSQLKSGTQNFYKMNSNSFLAMRTPLAARPKEVNVKPRQTNSQGPSVSQEKVDHAAGTAAFKFYEVDEKLEVLNVAVEERDRTIELSEQTDLILLLAEELHKECSQGKIVALD